jgi:uncharacterized caspase-like protein
MDRAGAHGDDGKTSALLVAIEKYDRYPKLENVKAAASKLARALVECGMFNAFPDGLEGGGSQKLATGITRWLGEAGSNDRLFLYWSGHGKREGDGFYLITSESPENNLSQTNAVEPRAIAKSAATSKAHKVLIVLDACFSGEAVGEVISTISRVLCASTSKSAGGRRL